MAGLLTYALFESLPILSRTVTIRYSKSYLAITAAGTVAEFSLSLNSPESKARHSLFRLILSFKIKSTNNAFAKLMEILLDGNIIFRKWKELLTKV